MRGGGVNGQKIIARLAWEGGAITNTIVTV